MSCAEAFRSGSTRRRLSPFGICGFAPKPLRRALLLLALWCERARTRLLLARLDDKQLKDIGVSRADAEREWRKPFWRS
jgi:uncharacterized protein YjiS (DUF1127 family)